MSSLQHYMIGLKQFIAQNKQAQDIIKSCNCGHHGWEKLLGCRPEVMIEMICCKKEIFQHLSIQGKDPAFIPWKCTRGKCEECGVVNKLGMSKCKFWNECIAKIDVNEWIHAPHQGITSGKQNTQL
eukprot:12137749-Ditylum_brightwellii.AAC.1